MKSRSSKTKRLAERKRAPTRWPDALSAEVIADSVVREVSHFLRARLPGARYADALSARAVRCFAAHAGFRRMMLGARCREQLAVFMRHWTASLLQRERPDLWECLPPSFDVGHPLPEGTGARVKRRGSGPRRKALRWNPRRMAWSAGRPALAA